MGEDILYRLHKECEFETLETNDNYINSLLIMQLLKNSFMSFNFDKISLSKFKFSQFKI